MEIISFQKSEEEILVATADSTTVKDIAEDFRQKAECCVDHLCGCGSGPNHNCW